MEKYSKTCHWYQLVGHIAIAGNLLLIALQVVSIKADYQLEITFHSYSNPNGTISTGYCCDSESSRPPNCDRQGSCDTGFTFCLRNLGEQRNGNSIICPLGRYETHESVGGDRITFDGQSYIENPGVPNPLVFTGTEWPGGIQFYVQVKDVESGQLIDDVYIETSLIPGRFLHRQSYHGKFTLVSITLSFNVTCTGRNNGPNCNPDLCNQLTSPLNGHVNQPDTIVNGSIAMYTCYRCYKLYGASTRTCLSGKWTNSEPTCAYDTAQSQSDCSTHNRDTPSDSGHHGSNLTGLFGLLASPVVVVVVIVICCCCCLKICTEEEEPKYAHALVRVS